ncbi:putative had-like protein [Mycena venus]|uniref:Putative had-like protein n=1 Tax=Mycena venus TaxID=2733690 RepID=A0A8H7CSU6_9AGAR|nr:putative had-like protein [Mycena venus]
MVSNQIPTADHSILKGMQFLYRNAGNMPSITREGNLIYDNFSQLLIWETTEEKELVSLEYHKRTWNYFIGSPIGTTKTYPDDVDTTSYALRLLSTDRTIADSVLDDMMSPRRTNKDGIITAYFDDTRHQIDPTVCINVLRCFYHYGRGKDPALEPTKDWVCTVLFRREYANGTRYYPSPYAFLFFFALLLHENPSSDLPSVVISLLRVRLAERANTDSYTDALELAMRALAFRALGMTVDVVQMRCLLDLQEEDGSWPTGWLCRYGKTGIGIGNKYLATALAVRALEDCQGWKFGILKRTQAG